MNGTQEKSSPRDIVKPRSDMNGSSACKVLASPGDGDLIAKMQLSMEQQSAGSCVKKVPDNQKRFTPPSLRSVSWPLESELEVPGTPKTPRTSTTPGNRKRLNFIFV